MRLPLRQLFSIPIRGWRTVAAGESALRQLKLSERRKMSGKTSGSGNAMWQAIAVKYRFRRGRPGFPTCMALKRNGQVCGNLAMRGVSVCQCHGGRMLVARLRFQRKAHGRRRTFA